MKKLAFAVVFAVALTALAAPKAAPAPAAKEPAKEAAKDPKEAVQALWDKVADAMNKADPKAFTALWADDGTLINPGGVIGKNKDGVEKVFAGDLATILKGSKNKLTVESLRVISPDAIWVDGSHDATGVKAPDGKDGLHIHLVTLLVQKGGQWWIAEARPYAFLPPPPAAAAPAPAKK